jgi:hypothetical protein
MAQIDKSKNSGGEKKLTKSPDTVELSAQAVEVSIQKLSLREQVTTGVLALFKFSLIGTLVATVLIGVIDHLFIGLKIITSEQRLLSERVLMTLIAATVVQVGAALAAIVFAVFKTGSEPSGEDGRSGT